MWRVFTYNIVIQIHTISEKILQTYYSSWFIHKNIASYLKTHGHKSCKLTLLIFQNKLIYFGNTKIIKNQESW
jgi:hypothetical protein